MNILFLGGGEIGHALELLLKWNTKDIVSINVWDKNPQKIQPPLKVNQDAEKVLSQMLMICDVLFLCVPSWVLKDVLSEISRRLLKKTIVISVSKGIDQSGQLSVDEVLLKFLPKDQRFALLSGPMIAEELDQGLTGGAVVATWDLQVFEVVKKLFRMSPLVLSYSNDLRGVAMSGVLKNIYAIGLGIVEGLELGSNTRGLLITQAIIEMSLIVKILGGKKETFLGVAGIGDFLATGLSHYSRNHQFGYELSVTGQCQLECEGLKSLPGVVTLLANSKSFNGFEKFPIFRSIERVIDKGENAKTVFNDLLREELL